MTATLSTNVFNSDITNTSIKVKLKQQEIKLLKERLKLCDNIIISAISGFSTENRQTFDKHKQRVHIYVHHMEEANYAAYYKAQAYFTGDNSIVEKNCIKFIEKQLAQWIQKDSVIITRNANTLNEYCQAAESNWNMYKTDMINNYFRTSIAPIINAFTRKAAAEFFNNRFADLQQLYAHYLQAMISKDITTHLKVTKKESAFTEQKMNINSSNDRMKKANEIHEICKRKFQTSLLALHYEINSYGSQSQTMETNAIECNNNGISASLNSMPAPSEMTVNPTAAHSKMYGNHHQANYTVKACRSNPLGRKEY